VQYHRVLPRFLAGSTSNWKFEGACGFGGVSRRSAYAVSTDLRRTQRLVWGDFSAVRQPGNGFRAFGLRWKPDAAQNTLEARIRS